MEILVTVIMLAEQTDKLKQEELQEPQLECGTTPYKILNCYNLSNVIGTQLVNGLFGIISDYNIQNCYILENTTDDANKTGTITQFNASNMGENFVDDELVEGSTSEYKYNNGYPILKWQVEE